MKKDILTLSAALILVTAGYLGCMMLLSSCITTTPSLEGPDVATASWNAFCASRGYNPDNRSFSYFNEYLDTWCGSTEEEAALARLGIHI